MPAPDAKHLPESDLPGPVRRSVTRIEIADLVGDAFGPAGAEKASLLSTAAHQGAHPAVLDKLGELPNRRFRTMRDLWDHLPDVPIDHE